MTDYHYCAMPGCWELIPTDKKWCHNHGRSEEE